MFVFFCLLGVCASGCCLLPPSNDLPYRAVPVACRLSYLPRRAYAALFIVVIDDEGDEEDAEYDEEEDPADEEGDEDDEEGDDDEEEGVDEDEDEDEEGDEDEDEGDEDEDEEGDEDEEDGDDEEDGEELILLGAKM